MNRITLLLNVSVLVVTFVLAMSATDSQIGLLKSASGMTMYSARPRASDSTVAYFRVVQSLDNIVPRTQKVTSGQLDAIYHAVRRYRQVVQAGVSRNLGASETQDDPRLACQQIGKEAREAVEHELADSFPEPSVLQRLATEVIRNSR